MKCHLCRRDADVRIRSSLGADLKLCLVCAEFTIDPDEADLYAHCEADLEGDILRPLYSVRR